MNSKKTQLTRLDYRLISKKGEGTFSEVIKAQSIKNAKFYAIKCMKNHFDNPDQVLCPSPRSKVSEKFRPLNSSPPTRTSSSSTNTSSTACSNLSDEPTG